MTAHSNDLAQMVSGKNGPVLLWGATALAVAIFMCSVNTSALVLGASLWAKILAVLAGAAMGLAGALVGRGIRNFARPDFILTTGGALSLVWAKLFWSVGPQVLGLLIGVVLGEALVLR